jgi:uncharacterized protein
VTDWLNEPPEWREDDGELVIRTAGKVDFWRNTLVDYVEDSAHLYYDLVDGDFVATVRFGGDYRDQYDQAGLVVRQDDRNWLKCGVELVNGEWSRDYRYRGAAHLVMAGLTVNGWSEWSTLPQLPENPERVWMRVIRDGSTLFVDWSLDGEEFTVLKLCALPDAGELAVGRYAAAPAGGGFVARFDSYSLETP